MTVLPLNACLFPAICLDRTFLLRSVAPFPGRPSMARPFACLSPNQSAVGDLLSAFLCSSLRTFLKEKNRFRTKGSVVKERIDTAKLESRFCGVECRGMRRSGWTPSIVPEGDDQNVYLVMDDRVWREIDAEATDLETVIVDLLDGQYKNPVRVVGFNTAEKWSQDVSADVAGELRRRCDLQLRDVPYGLQEFVARYEGRCRDPAAAADAPGLTMAFQRKKPAAIGVKAPLPGFIEPALATGIAKVPSGERWIHEIKFDGYRVQLRLAHESVKLFTRRGHDWSLRFRLVISDLSLLVSST